MEAVVAALLFLPAMEAVAAALLFLPAMEAVAAALMADKDAAATEHVVPVIDPKAEIVIWLD